MATSRQGAGGTALGPSPASADGLDATGNFPINAPSSWGPLAVCPIASLPLALPGQAPLHTHTRNTHRHTHTHTQDC